MRNWVLKYQDDNLPCTSVNNAQYDVGGICFSSYQILHDLNFFMFALYSEAQDAPSDCVTLHSSTFNVRSSEVLKALSLLESNNMKLVRTEALLCLMLLYLMQSLIDFASYQDTSSNQILGQNDLDIGICLCSNQAWRRLSQVCYREPKCCRGSGQSLYASWNSTNRDGEGARQYAQGYWHAGIEIFVDLNT